MQNQDDAADNIPIMDWRQSGFAEPGQPQPEAAPASPPAPETGATECDGIETKSNADQVHEARPDSAIKRCSGFQDLNFKVTPEFYRYFKTLAAVKNLYNKELLEAAVRFYCDTYVDERTKEFLAKYTKV